MIDTDTIVDDMIDGYIECAIWTGLDWDNQTGGNPDPLDQRYGVDDVSEEAIASIREDVTDFVNANRDDLELYTQMREYDPSKGTIWEWAGHDFFLTRNRHGAGFWDRGLGDVGDRLSDAARVYGESDLYVGDDGKLYVP